MKRHVKERSVLSCFPPSSPGSCLAHKESSKSPFLPIFLPLVLSLPLPKSQPLFRPSLFSRPSFSSSFSSLLASQLLSSVPFSLLSPHANARTKRNCSRGPSSPHLTRVLLDPLLYPVLPSLSRLSSPNLFVYLAKFDSPTRSDLTFRSLLVPRLSSLPRLSSYHRDSLRAGIFLLVLLLA